MIKPKSRKNTLKSAVNKLLEEENAIDDSSMYVKTVLEAFDEIKFLRTKKVNFEKICKLFASLGLLPENANFRSFQQAFYREQKRREKNHSRSAMDNGKIPPVVAPSAKEPVTDKTQPSAEAKTETEKERLKRLTGTVVETPSGKIRKLPGGTFEF